MIYKRLYDIHGGYTIYLVGIDEITEERINVDITPLFAEFPDLEPAKLRHLEGPVDVLVGMDNRPIHPKFVAESGGLRVVSSLLGSGLILTGASDKVEGYEAVTPLAHHVSRASRDLPAGSSVCHISA